MAKEYHKNHIACCVCEFWEGQRDISGNRNVLVEKDNLYAKCRNPQNPINNGHDTAANFSCLDYFKKWHMIP